MEEITVEFVIEKDTSHTTRFKEIVPEGQGKKIGTLYVQKETLEQMGKPKQLTVTIKAKQ